MASYTAGGWNTYTTLGGGWGQDIGDSTLTELTLFALAFKAADEHDCGYISTNTPEGSGGRK